MPTETTTDTTKETTGAGRTAWTAWLHYHQRRCEVWRGLMRGWYGTCRTVALTVGEGVVLKRARGEFEDAGTSAWVSWCVETDGLLEFVARYAGRLRFVACETAGGTGLAQVCVADELTALWTALRVDASVARFVSRWVVRATTDLCGRGNTDDLRGDLHLLAMDLLERFMPTSAADFETQWAKYLERSMQLALVNYRQRHRQTLEYERSLDALCLIAGLRERVRGRGEPGQLDLWKRFLSYPCPTLLAHDEVPVKRYQWEQWLVARKTQPRKPASRRTRVRLG